jgi:hypothetical protein
MFWMTLNPITEPPDSRRPRDVSQNLKPGSLKIVRAVLSREGTRDHRVRYLLACLVRVLVRRKLLADVVQHRRHFGHRGLIKLHQHFDRSPGREFYRSVERAVRYSAASKSEQNVARRRYGFVI